MASPHRPFAIPLLLLAPLPLLLLLLLVLLALRLDDERARVSAQLDAHAQSVSLALGSYLQDIDRHLRTLSRHAPQDAGQVAAFLEEARALQQLTGVGIRLATPAGQTLVHLESRPPDLSMPATERLEQPFVVEVPVDPARGGHTLSALIAPEDIRAVVGRAGLPPGWDLRIIGPGGREVADRRASGPGSRLASISPTSMDGWWTHVSAPASVVYASLWQSAGRELMLLLLATVAAPPIAWEMARNLRRRHRSADPALRHELLHHVEARQQAIARELHDGVGSSCAGIGLLLATARAFTSEPRALDLLDKALEQVARTTQQVREISRGMMPVGQDAGGLLLALENLASEISDIQGVVCKVLARGDFDDVPAAQGTHLFHIVQEATGNALQHGRATHVRILLARVGRCCRLTVLDNGIGCNPAMLFGPTAGLGMRSMRTRAEAMGGHMDVRAQPGRGLRLRINWLAPPSGDPEA